MSIQKTVRSLRSLGGIAKNLSRMAFRSTGVHVFPYYRKKLKLEEINSSGKEAAAFLDIRETIHTYY